MTIAPRPYRVGEVVLMDYQGWLKAFRVVKMEVDGDAIQYTLAMVELEKDASQWQRPVRGD